LEYTDAIALLQKNKKEIKWGDDLSREHEKFLCEEHFNSPVFVINWPKSMKPFYMRVNDDDKTVGNFDLILPQVGELIGGSIREERYEVLEQQMKDHNISLESLQWYLDLRKFGTAPHGGFGLGFERLLSFVTGLKNVRDVIAVPRHYGGCKF
jgi:asparaginyl-tRNA synthetase